MISDGTILGHLICSLAECLEQEFPVKCRFSQWTDSRIPPPVNMLTLWFQDAPVNCRFSQWTESPHAILEFHPDYIIIHSGFRFTARWLYTTYVDYADPAMLDQIYTTLF